LKKSSMKLKFLIVPALMTTALFAQNRGGFGPRTSNGATATPPTAGELATRELQMVSAFLSLDATQTSTLIGNTGLVADLTTEETTLQGNRTALQTDYTSLGASIAAVPPTSTTAAVADISTRTAANLQARVTAAGQIVTALGSLGLTSTQQGKVPKLVTALVDGGLVGFRGPRAH
jgi:hypothetical protein